MSCDLLFLKRPFHENDVVSFETAGKFEISSDWKEELEKDNKK
jgi:hypothetical protein